MKQIVLRISRNVLTLLFGVQVLTGCASTPDVALMQAVRAGNVSRVEKMIGTEDITVCKVIYSAIAWKNVPVFRHYVDLIDIDADCKFPEDQSPLRKV